jgi:hypothetical protein
MEVINATKLLDIESDTARSLVWDPSRHCLWYVDGCMLRSCDISYMTAIATAVKSVPELASFPPGLIPECLKYVGPVNSWHKREHYFDITTIASAAGILPRTRWGTCTFNPIDNTLLFAFSTPDILHFDPSTGRSCRYNVTERTGLLINFISPYCNGHFVLSDGGTCAIWPGPPSHKQVQKTGPVMLGHRPMVEDMHGKVYMITSSRIISLDLASAIVHGGIWDIDITPPDDIRTQRFDYQGTYPLLLADAQNVCYMNESKIIPIHAADSALDWNGPLAYRGTYPISASCNNETVVFYIGRGAIYYLELPHTDINNTKRRRVES